jgi:hypothetical protein
MMMMLASLWSPICNSSAPESQHASAVDVWELRCWKDVMG